MAIKYFDLPDPPEAFRLLSPFAAASTSYRNGVKSIALNGIFSFFMLFSRFLFDNNVVLP